MTKKRLLMIIGSLLSLCSLMGCAILWLVYRANSAQGLTPELVVDMFSSAGYDVSELRAVPQYPGPLSDKRIKQGGEFDIRFTDATVVRVYVAFYSNGFNASYVTRESNALNRRMNGGFAYAYRRGSVVLSIGTFDSNVAQELSRVFLEK